MPASDSEAAGEGLRPRFDDLAASVYGPVIAAQVAVEISRRGSIESRALSVAQTALSLVTLVGAVTGVGIVRGDGNPLSYVTVALATLSLLASAALAMRANTMGNTLGKFGGLDASTVTAWTREPAWTSADKAGAESAVAKAHLEAQALVHADNEIKRRLLGQATVAELVAIALIPVAVLSLGVDYALATYVGLGIALALGMYLLRDRFAGVRRRAPGEG
jgi:hypothetical protein